MGYYTLNYVNSDTGGANYFPPIPGDISADYGRAAFDIRQRIFFGGTFGVPRGFRLSPFLIANREFRLTLRRGRIFTAMRSSIRVPPLLLAAPARRQVSSKPTTAVSTRFRGGAGSDSDQRCDRTRTLYFEPSAKQNIWLWAKERNHSQWRARRNRHVWPRPRRRWAASGGGMFGGGTPSNYRYNLTFSANARNLFNNVNYGNPIGNLRSPLFGEANSLAGQPYSSSTANRRIDLQVQFTF